MPSLCYRGAYQGSFGGRPIERPKLLFYSGRRHTWRFVRTHSHTVPTYFCLFLSPTHTHTSPHSPLISAISHSISLYNGCAVLEPSLNPCSCTLSPGPDYDTVGWGRRKTLWPCLIKMVKSCRRIGKLILLPVASSSPPGLRPGLLKYIAPGRWR